MEEQNNGGMTGMPESSGMPVWGGEESAPLPSPPALRRSGRTANLAAKKAAAEAEEAAKKAAEAQRKLANSLMKEELKPRQKVPNVNRPGNTPLHATSNGMKPHSFFERQPRNPSALYPEGESLATTRTGKAVPTSSIRNPFLGTGNSSYSGLPHPPSRFGWGTAPTVPMASENQDDELGNLAGSMGKMGMGGNSRRRKSTSRKSKKSRKSNSKKSKKSRKSRKTSRRN